MNVTSGMVVYEKVIEKRVMEKLPFMATENIMMRAAERGGDRQELHERLRVHSHAAARKVKLEGGANDLIERIAADKAFGLTMEEIKAEYRPELYIGRSVSQTERFLQNVAKPVIDRIVKEDISTELKV
jgi:adenylosuccinate lyase